MKKKQRLRKRKGLLKKLDRKIIGYHVYRSGDENLPFKDWTRLTAQPVKDGEFNENASAVPGKRFYYKLTRVDSLGRESGPFTPKSTYTDHAGNVSDQNPLVDFGGYNIYRSADSSVPPEKWERRNAQPLPTTEFKDEGVASGEVYFYFVRAVDSIGTESAPSEILRVVRK